MVDNPNKYSEMGTGGSLGDIRDDDDFPHAGIIKALSDGLGQNYAISGFTATNISATSVDIAAGKIMRDGKIVDVAGATLTIAAGSGSTGNTYSILVAPASGGVTRIQGTVKNKTPNVPAGNTIIGVLVHTGSNPMQLQYLTVDKSENHLSIARDNSGTYTEGLTIKSNAGDIEIEALEQDKDIIIKGNDGGVSTTVATFDMSEKTLIVPSKLSTNTIQLGYGSGPAKLQVYNTGDNMEIYAAGDSGGNVKILELDAGTDGAEANRIATVTGKLTASLAVEGNTIVKTGGTAAQFLKANGTVDSNTYLTAEADTLDSVTGRGDTTSNSITVSDITSVRNQNISYEVVSNGPITGTKTVVYIETLAGVGNTVALPAPASGNILYIINLGGVPVTVTGTPLINNGQVGHPKLTGANQITLAPFEHITLQAVNDSLTPLQTGHMIISD